MVRDYSDIYNSQNSKKKAVIYDEIEKVVDRETGEISVNNQKQLIKRTQTPDFIMLFTQTSPMLANAKLTTAQSSVLFNILTGNHILRDNFLDLGAATRSELEQKTGLKKNTINQSISALTKKEIFLRKKVGSSYRYLLNPFIFGKGNFQNVESLRYEVSLDYNFKKLEFKEGNKTSTKYEDLEEVLEIPHKIVDANQSTDENGLTKQVIEVEEIKEQKMNNKEQLTLFQTDDKEQNTSIIDKEIELVKQQNLLKQLSIKELELKIKAQEMGIV